MAALAGGPRPGGIDDGAATGAVSLNIGLVIWRLDVRGGAQRQMIELAHALAPGASVRLYAWSFDPKSCYGDRLAGLDVQAAGRPGEWRDALAVWGGRSRWRYAVASLLSWWGRERPARRLADLVDPATDVLNLHDHHMPEVAEWVKRRRPGVRTVWMMNDLPLVFQSLARVEADEASRADAAAGPWRVARRLLWAAEARRQRRLARWMDEICVLSDATAAQVRRFYGREARVIRSGVDVAKAGAPVARASNIPIILTVGILFRYRRFEDLLDAAARLRVQGRRFRVRLVGSARFDPGYARDLEARAASLGVTDIVTFEGEVSEDVLSRAYREADVFVFTSSQTWGLAVFEAMAAGLPVVVSSAAGAAEVLQDGVTGCVVPSGDPEALAQALARLLDDPALRARLAKAGADYVRAEHSWDAYARRMLRTFRPEASRAA